MATDKEYKAVIDALSGECERLHKENEELKKALKNHDTFMKYSYSQGKQDALSQEPCDDTVSIRNDVLKCRIGKLVVYNVEWLKKHWQMEMDIVCGAKMESEEQTK